MIHKVINIQGDEQIINIVWLNAKWILFVFYKPDIDLNDIMFMLYCPPLSGSR